MVAGTGTCPSGYNAGFPMNHKEIERWYRLRNMKAVAQFLMLVAVLVLLVGYAISIALMPRPEPITSTVPAGEGSRIENFSYSAVGVNPWELKALSAVVSKSLDRVALDNPSVVYEGGKGGKIYLSAKSGELDRKNNNVSGKGNVSIRYKDFLFSTGSIDYRHERREADTEAEVSLEGADLSLTGKGLKFSLEREEIVIEQDVKARLYDVKWVEPGHRLPL